MLLNVLEVIAPFKHFSKLREFVLMKLPPGFPVKIGEQELFVFILMLWLTLMVVTHLVVGLVLAMKDAELLHSLDQRSNMPI
jgi:hypothetical protein